MIWNCVVVNAVEKKLIVKKHNFRCYTEPYFRANCLLELECDKIKLKTWWWSFMEIFCIFTVCLRSVKAGSTYSLSEKLYSIANHHLSKCFLLFRLC